MRPYDKEKNTILYRDNHLLVCHKEGGIVTQSSQQKGESLEDFIRQWLMKQDNKKKVFLEATHRLDRVTSGVVVFARTRKALGRVQKAFREREVHKTYLALVEGTLSSQEGVLEHFLQHDSYRSCIVKAHVKNAKRALLRYRVLQQEEGHSCVEILLYTGRYHQIRVQFAAIGHPVVGDTKYGARISSQLEKAIALHHWHLEMEHPVLKEKKKWYAPPPAIFSCVENL